MQHHHYSLTEIEMLIPWEREVYLNMLLDYLKEKKEQERQRAMKYG
jgi:hypothetical protein